MSNQPIDFDFSAGVQKKGTKVSESSNPELTLDSSYGKFSFNTAALDLMGLPVGGHVVLFDQKDQGAESQENRFYAAPIDYTDEDGKPLGATIGKQKSFNFSGVYNSVLANDFEQKAPIPRELMSQGLLVATDYGKTVKYIATKKIVMSVEFLGEKTLDLNQRWGIDVEIPVNIYSLTIKDVLDHTPSAQGETYDNLGDLYAARGQAVPQDAGYEVEVDVDEEETPDVE